MANILAIHGLGCSADQGWPRVAAALAPDHELVTPRLDGADGPASLPSSEWGMLAQARRIARELSREAPHRATASGHVGPQVTGSAPRLDVLVGHSMGGALAIRVAEISRPRRLILVEPHVVPSAGFVVRPTLDSGPDGPSEALLAKMRAIDTGEGSYDAWIRRWDWRVFHAMSVDLAKGDGGSPSWLESLAALDVPTTLLWGAKSGPTESDLHVRALLKMGVPLTIVEGTSHWMPSEVPDALARLLVTSP